MQVTARLKGEEGPKLGKDVIEYFMGLAMRYACAYEPTEDDLTHSENANLQDMRDWKRNQFKGWARLAVAWAADLAPYQSPTFRAISISHQTEKDKEDRGTTVLHSMDQVKQLLLSRGVSPEQFGRAMLEPMPPMIEHDQADKDNGQDAG
jgi:hypothetical protein